MKIRVRVFLRAGRTCYEAQWSDPVTGRKRTRSTGETVRREAERFAAKLEKQLEEGGGLTERITWAEFRQRYETEVLPGRALKTRQKMRSTLNAVENLIDPKYVMAMTAAQVSRFQAKLRETGVLETTIKSHLSCLRALLRWAETMNYIRKAPAFIMPEGVAGMKGRPLTMEEFERIRDKAAAVVGDELAPSWQFLLEGLWWSGLRLGEAMNLHWTDSRRICVELADRRPMFRVQAAAEKGRQFRLLPMAPEFAEFLRRVPEDAREGYVFNPGSKEGLARLSAEWVSKRISRMGEVAGVKVAQHDRTDAEGAEYLQTKFGSAHDFRRAFGFRWSKRVLAPVLMELMRHSSISTTLTFYVGRNAEATADQAWQAFANESANSSANNRAVEQSEGTQC